MKDPNPQSKLLPVPIGVVRSRRRTFALEVGRGPTLVVRVPYGTTDRAVSDFLQGHTSWIAAHVAKERARTARFHGYGLAAGCFCFVRGREYRVCWEHGAKSVSVVGNRLNVACARIDDVPSMLTRWFRREARLALEASVHSLISEGLRKPSEIRITSARTRWGSCSARGTVSLAWRSLMVPPPVFRYIVAHELTHLEHLDHSRRFWSRLEAVCPGHREHRAWLREHAPLLDI